MRAPFRRQAKPAPMLTEQVRQMITDFGQRPGVTDDHLDSLRYVVDSSPTLIRQLNLAAARDDLRSFDVLPTDSHAGAQYDGENRVIELPLSLLDHDRHNEAAFILAHEAKHANNRSATADATNRFRWQVHQAAQPGASCDYSDPIERLLSVQRQDEASANLAGWNALVDHVRSQNPRATLKDVAKASPVCTEPFVERSGPLKRLRPQGNLRFRPDLKLELDAANIEAMGQNYFDKPDHLTGLGQDGNASYTNYYLSWAVSNIAATQRQYIPPKPGVPERPMIIDLSRPGYDHERIEGAGIHLGWFKDPIPMLDRGTTPATSGWFHHTAKPETAPQPDPEPQSVRNDHFRVSRSFDDWTSPSTDTPYEPSR